MKIGMVNQSNSISHKIAYPKLLSHARQAFVARPKLRFACQQTTGQQMRIHKANAFTHQRVPFNHLQYLIMRSLKTYAQITQQAKYLFAVLQITASQLTQNHRVTTHSTSLQKSNQRGIARAQMVNPHRGIHQHHHALSACVKSVWRREGTTKLGSEPPNRDNRFALSRSIKAFKPSRKTVDFSLIPVSSVALANKASSIFKVVRITKLQKHQNKHHCMLILMHALQATFSKDPNL
jgi:hypothetical protein